MPVCLEPEQRFPVVLDSDMGKPLATRPTFFVLSLSMREQSALSAGMDAALSHTKTNDVLSATCELVKKYLVGWSNMGKYTFPESDIQEFLTHREARELLTKLMVSSYVSLEEKKSSE
jgi:hypothetical protein